MANYLGKLRGKDLTDESPIEELEEAASLAMKTACDMAALGHHELSERSTHAFHNLTAIILMRKAVA